VAAEDLAEQDGQDQQEWGVPAAGVGVEPAAGEYAEAGDEVADALDDGGQ
jgi:hypothetical protein